MEKTYFGRAVALSGETALIGSSAWVGSGYVFVRGTNGLWRQEARLGGGGPVESVALSGDVALVGVPAGLTFGGTFTGLVWVYGRTGTAWTGQAILRAEDEAASDQFGSSVALSGNTVLVGAQADDAAHPLTGGLVVNYGSLYVFRLSTPRAPAVSLGAASGLSASGALLNGTVNPNGCTTDARFEYGPTASYGSTAYFALSPYDGTAPQNVSAALTGLAPGTYRYRLTATNAAGTSATANGIFTTAGVPGPLETWRQQHFSTMLDEGPAANTSDPDGDGLNNLLEWSLGARPLQRDAHPLAAMHREGTIFAVTYTRNPDAGATCNVTWTDDTATGPWSNAGVIQTVLNTNGSVETVRATIPATALRRFVRLEVVAP